MHINFYLRSNRQIWIFFRVIFQNIFMILLIIESNEKPIVKNLSQIVDNNTNYNANELIEDNIINENNSKLKEIKMKN